MSLHPRRLLIRLAAASPLAAYGIGASGQSAAPGTAKPKRKPDLGDLAEGIYRGEIISDSRGTSSAPGEVVTVTIRRTGVNRVQIESDNQALPGVTVSLQRVMDKVMNTDSKSNVLLDPRQQPMRLDYSPGMVVSFSGLRG